MGDNIEWDVGAPQKLGIHGVWVNRNGSPVAERFPSIAPDLVIKELADLLR